MRQVMELYGKYYSVIYHQAGNYVLLTVGKEPVKGYLYNARTDTLTKWFE